MNDLKALEKNIDENPYDSTTLGIFADLLQEYLNFGPPPKGLCQHLFC